MRRLAPVAAATLVFAACGGSSTTGSDRPVEARPDVVVVRVVTRGGFVAEASHQGEPPQLSVFGDGRVIIVGPTTLQFPGPALPNLQEFRVSRAGLRGILGEARYAGLLADEPATSVSPISPRRP
jgi:hypothetical protein